MRVHTQAHEYATNTLTIRVFFAQTRRPNPPRTWAGVFVHEFLVTNTTVIQYLRILVRAPCLHVRTYVLLDFYTHIRYVSSYICIYILYIYVCIYIYMYVYIRVVLSFVLRLGTGITGQKRTVRRRKKGKGERVEGRKGHGEEEEDRLVARIRFRTVSNDTGQDTTMFSKILIPRHLFLPSFFLLFLPSFFFFLFLFFSSSFLPLVRSRDGTVREIRGGRKSRGNEESTVSRGFVARLHGLTCFSRLFLLIFTSFTSVFNR